MESVSKAVIKNATSGICIPLLTANSQGIFKRFTGSNVAMPVEYKLPLMHVRFVLIFLTTQLMHVPLKRFGLSPLVSQIIAGIILSPSALGSTKMFRNVLAPQPAPDSFLVLLQISFAFYLFLFGVKVDVSMIFRTGKKAWTLGIASFFAPIVLSFTYASSTNLPGWKFYIAALQSCSSFAVISSLLHDLKLVNTELGRLGLSAAFISDMGNIIIIPILLGAQRFSREEALRNSMIFVGYLLFLLFVPRRVMLWIIRQTPEGKPVKDIYIYLILATMFASSIFTQTYAHQIYMGAHFLGVMIPDGPPLGSALIKKTESFTIDVLLPLLTSLCMMLTDSASLFREFKFPEVHIFCIILVLVVFLAKFGASVSVLLCCKLPPNHAIALALLMSYQGIFELNAVALSIYFNKKIPKEVFSVLSTCILLNTAIFPNLLRVLYNPSKRHAGYQKRNIIDLKANSELKILACIHRPDDIACIKTLFDVCQQTNSPITAYVLHLVELVGQLSPVFISHQLQKKTHSENSSSAAIVRSFSRYEQETEGAVSVNIFTAISPVNIMQEDIHTLALDKVASLIVLPFHRKWSVTGLLESESNTIRTLNCGLLETAPCTVGILVDHGNTGAFGSSEFSYRVGMIFIGGKDDCEALSLARRMAGEPHICLTVLRFCVVGDDLDADWDIKLDNVLMEETRSDSLIMNNLIYIDENVNDGVEIAARLQRMMDEFDLFIVGRRYRSESSLVEGLRDWCEFPELGVIGDLLASAEFNSSTSVLILQQQDLKS